MSEVLYIRLGSQQQDKIFWLVWSGNEKEIIASGELASAEMLSSLTDKARHRTVVAIVPNQDVMLKSLQVPGKSERAIRMAAPYMLEDELAQDVEQLFFGYGRVSKDSGDANCHVAITKKEQMALWLQWLTDADISCNVMTPEVLALPNKNDQWSMLAFDQTLVVRQSDWQGMSLEHELLDVACQKWQAQELPPIHGYTELPAQANQLEVIAEPADLPLAIIAQQGKPSFNLLQGEYKPAKQQVTWIKNWSLAAGLLAFALLLSLGQKGLAFYQVKIQQAAIEQQIKEQYLAAFPKTKRVRISTVKSQLKSKLAETGRASNKENFLAMLMQMERGFSQVKSLKPTSIKFDGKRGELRIQASAQDYQAFDQFKSILEQQGLMVSQGAQNSQGTVVTGSISIKRRS